MNAKRTCCCCFSLRTGCIIIGVLSILLDLMSMSAMRVHWSALLVDMTSNILLVVGAVMQVRGLLLPAMILGTMTNVLLWIAAVLTLFGSTVILSLFAGDNSDGFEAAASALLTILTITFVFGAIVHLLVLRNIFQHFSELAEEQQRGLFQTTTTTFVLLPGATMNASAINDPKLSYGQV